MWLSLFLLLSVPFDILVLLVSRCSAVGLDLLVSYSIVSCLLRFFVVSHSLQVNDYSFLFKVTAGLGFLFVDDSLRLCWHTLLLCRLVSHGFCLG